MPTKKPRLTVTIDEDMQMALNAYADSTGQPVSKFVFDVLKGLMPTIQAVTQAYEVSKNISVIAGAELNTALCGVATGVSAANVRAVADLSLAVGRASASSDDGQNLGENGKVSGVNPLATNRGVRSNRVRENKRGGRTLWVASSREESL